jgi:hypothetical protein
MVLLLDEPVPSLFSLSHSGRGRQTGHREARFLHCTIGPEMVRFPGVS